MGYYKLNTDGTIQSRSKQVDDTWLPLSELETKEDGSYYKYYNQDGTPDLVKEQADIDAKAKQEAEAIKDEQLKKLTVTIGSGKVFYADAESRIDLRDAIELGNDLGQTSTYWKLAEEFNGSKVAEVTLDELKEASKLALETKATIIGV